MIRTTMSLALLKANWDLYRKSYIDNFVPILAECIRVSRDDVVSVTNLRDQLRADFGLEIPLGAVRTILNRTRRYGYVNLDNRVYKPNRKKLEELHFDKVRKQIESHHTDLVSKLRNFAEVRQKKNWNEQDAENAIERYLEENQLLLLIAVSHGTVIPEAKGAPLGGARYLVGEFIRYLQEHDEEGFGHLLTIVQGHMLANSIFLPDPGRVSKKFRATSIYLDTSVLMYALGYTGKQYEEPAKELFTLLYGTGADLKCFEHTADEIRGILYACSQIISTRDMRYAYGPSIDYFVTTGRTSSDIELLAAKLDDSLAHLKVTVTPKPPYDERYVINESGLEAKLGKEIRYTRDIALQRDVDSLSAIMRLRRGREYFEIENCAAMFVTTNKKLAKVAGQFFYQDPSPGSIAPVISDYSLSNLLWLKSPVQAPELPLKRMIADYYAATRPSERLMQTFMKEVEKARQNREVTEDQYYWLRFSIEAKAALMDIAEGSEEAVVHGTVGEILRRVQEEIQAASEIEREMERQRGQALEDDLRRARERERSIDENYRVRATRLAKPIARVLTFSIAVVLTIGVVASFPWDFPTLSSTPVRYTISGLQVMLLLAGAANLLWGTTLKVVSRRIEVALELYIYRTLRRLFYEV